MIQMKMRDANIYTYNHATQVTLAAFVVITKDEWYQQHICTCK
jgi:hypothetical protein